MTTKPGTTVAQIPAPTREDLIADMQRVASEQRGEPMSRILYRAHGSYSQWAFRKIFGRFSDFRTAAGFGPHPPVDTPDPVVNAVPAAAPPSPKTKSTPYVIPPEAYIDEGPESKGTWVEGERYVYNGDLDVYTFFLRSTAKKQVIPGLQIRTMRRAYSNLGDGSTINEIARTFSMRRDIFNEIRQLLGWTHDSDIFTDEEIRTRPMNALVEDQISMGRSKLDQEYNRRSFRETKQDADRYREWQHFIVQPICDKIELAPTYEVPLMTFTKPKTRFAAFTSSGELHYNKHGWVGETGQSYNREIADARFASTTQAMVDRVSLFGRPEKWIYVVGNDDLHVDNLESKTTSGTPQDVSGTGRQMIEEFFELQVREIDRLRSVAPMVIKLSAGNHNSMLSFCIMKMLQSHYRSTRHIQVDVTAMPRSYELYGQTLMGITHGHQVKPIKLMQVMGIEALEVFSRAKYKAWFTGHLHSTEVENLVGGTRWQMPALSGPDRWHIENGYHSLAGLSGYIIDHEHGITDMLLCPAVDLPLGQLVA